MSVYAITDGVGIKIGHTNGRPADRLASLQTGSRVELQLLAVMAGDRSLERDLHDELADHRIRGEWFAWTPEVLEAIKAARQRAVSASLITLLHYVIASLEIARAHLIRGDHDAEDAAAAEIFRAAHRIRAVAGLLSTTSQDAKEGSKQ